MGKISFVNQSNFILKIQSLSKQKANRTAFDYNFDNNDIIKKLTEYFFSSQEEYSSGEFEKRLKEFNRKINQDIFGLNNDIPHKSSYISFYTGRGWPYEVAKEKIKNYSIFRNTSELFFNKFEILQYFKDINNFDINLQNVPLVTEILNHIQIPYGNISILQLREQLKQYFCMKYPELQKKSRGFITCQPIYWIVRGYSYEEAIQKISINQKRNSPLSIDYYKNKNIDETEAVEIISTLQRKNASCSKSTKNYWLKLGYSKEEATKQSQIFAAKRSVWSKEYWRNQGYTEQEAAQKCLEYNGMSSLCKKFHGSIEKFYKHMLDFSEKCKDRYILKREQLYALKNNDEKIKSISVGHGRISKQEIFCFEQLKRINPQIEHTPYIVAFPPDFISLQNKICYICDGYLKIGDYYIVIEYDGAIGKYHDTKVDKIKSEEILMVDNMVIGVLRIQETLFKNYQLLLNEGGLDNIINTAITNIVQGKKQIIILA